MKGAFLLFIVLLSSTHASHPVIHYRDIGVIAHHTRNPFETNPKLFTKHLRDDRNFTGFTPFQNREAFSSFGHIEMVRSNGEVLTMNSTKKKAVDVILGAYVFVKNSKASEACFVSYRGTDRDTTVYSDAYANDSLAGDEGMIPVNTRGDTFQGCTVKKGYKDNFLETSGYVYNYLERQAEAGRCKDGIVLMGMSMGSATADIAAYYLRFVYAKRARSKKLRELLSGNKLHVISLGGPRALGYHCSNRLQKSMGAQKKRFIYGSHYWQNALGDSNSCHDFTDPVAGNPRQVRLGQGRWKQLWHWGQVIVGHMSVPKTKARYYDIRKTLNARVRDRDLDEVACKALTGCMAKRFANAFGRISTGQYGNIKDLGFSDIDYGGNCSGPGLIPAHRYQFGRFHDTCSYRNFLAFYGKMKAGQRDLETYYRCNIYSDSVDPTDFPKRVRAAGGRYVLDIDQYGLLQ